MALLMISVGQVFAVQITPNPNPEGNTIIIAPPTPAENLVPFTNLGVINIQAAASFQNANRFENSGGVISAGRVTNSDVFNNNIVVNLLNGSQFHNESTGRYSGSGGTGINGTFLNEGSVSNSLMGWHVLESGQYIQRQGAASLVTPSTVMRDGVFINEGQVSLGAGNFVNERVAGYDNRATGTTHIEGIFMNQGRLTNAGKIELSSEGQFIQQRQQPSPIGLSTTLNAGTFTNAGRVRVGEGTTFSNFPTLALGSPPAVGGQYVQQAGGTTLIDGTFQNSGGRITNGGSITVTSTGTYFQTRSSAPVPGSPVTVNTGTFTNAGNTIIIGGPFSNHGKVVNTGTFTLEAPAAQLAGNGSYVQTASTAQTIVHGSFSNALQLQEGSLSGTGTVTGHVMQTGGMIQPGTVTAGVLTLTGGLTQQFHGRLDFKIGGLLAGSQYDVLRVSGGSLTLNGTLSASLIDGFKPRLGNRFNLLTCTQGCSGFAGGSLFTRLSLPSLSSGLAWVTSLAGIDNGVAFSLSVVSAPEPATLLLVGSGLVGVFAWRRKQRDQQVEG
jgi:hypothetical protein